MPGAGSSLCGQAVDVIKEAEQCVLLVVGWLIQYATPCVMFFWHFYHSIENTYHTTFVFSAGVSHFGCLTDLARNTDASIDVFVCDGAAGKLEVKQFARRDGKVGKL